MGCIWAIVYVPLMRVTFRSIWHGYTREICERYFNYNLATSSSTLCSHDTRTFQNIYLRFIKFFDQLWTDAVGTAGELYQ